jgi:hypothetical protein
MEEKAKYFEEFQDTKKIVERQDVGFNEVETVYFLTDCTFKSCLD